MRMKGELMGGSQISDSALYMPSRRILSDILRAGRQQDWTDADVEEMIKSYIGEKQEQESESPKRRVFAGAGDYFSQEDYDKVSVSFAQKTSGSGARKTGAASSGRCIKMQT